MDNDDFSPRKFTLPRPEDYELSWHKFLISFALKFSGALSVFFGIVFIVTIYNSGRDEPLFSESSYYICIFLAFGLGLLAVGGFTFYTRYQLAEFKTGAPAKLLILYGMRTVLMLAYLVLLSVSSNPPIHEWILIILIPLGVSAAVIFASKRYYDKRSELFVY